MRVDIKTKGKVKDNDIKALYLLHEAMKISSDRMRISNLAYIAEKYGYALLKNPK